MEWIYESNWNRESARLMVIRGSHCPSLSQEDNHWLIVWPGKGRWFVEIEHLDPNLVKIHLCNPKESILSTNCKDFLVDSISLQMLTKFVFVYSTCSATLSSFVRLIWISSSDYFECQSESSLKATVSGSEGVEIIIAKRWWNRIFCFGAILLNRF